MTFPLNRVPDTSGLFRASRSPFRRFMDGTLDLPSAVKITFGVLQRLRDEGAAFLFYMGTLERCVLAGLFPNLVSGSDSFPSRDEALIFLSISEQEVEDVRQGVSIAVLQAHSYSTVGMPK